MTLAEVMVSALILSISAQTSLQGWGRSSAAVTAADALQVQSRNLELYRLASLRLLQAADPSVLLSPDNASCRFEPQAIRQLLERNLPSSMAVRVQLQQASDAEGLWLNLSAPPATRTPNNPLQRRTLLTPAGLGLCALSPLTAASLFWKFSSCWLWSLCSPELFCLYPGAMAIAWFCSRRCDACVWALIVAGWLQNVRVSPVLCIYPRRVGLHPLPVFCPFARVR